MELIANALSLTGLNILPAGSAGLFAQISKLIGKKLITPGIPDGKIGGPVLVISGSPAAASKAQIEQARRNGETVIKLDGLLIAGDENKWQNEVQRVKKLTLLNLRGDAGVMKRAIGIVKVNLQVRPVMNPVEAQFQPGVADLLDLKNVVLAELEYGKVSPMAGQASFEYVKKATELALEEKIAAMITGPINKEAVNLAGIPFAGHTEMLAHFTGATEYAMMLIDGNLRVIHVSTHVSLRRACDLVTKKRVLQVIGLADDACKKLGIPNPKIVVAGLNPHAGENGLFGAEEEREIKPAIEEALRRGINVSGPLSPDTLFPKVKGGQYDIAVAMYHDQGHIPLKMMGFNWSESKKKWESVSGVNITLGLPVVRTSVDHGTAFDQAGKGTATEESLWNAIELGARLARRDRR